MIKQEYKDLISRLNEKTKQSKLVWNKTSSDNQFKLILENATILVTFMDEGFGISESIYIQMYNKSGGKIIIADEGKGSPDYQFIYNFYQDIISDNMQISQTITSVLQELQTENRIGKIVNYFDDDDAPF